MLQETNIELYRARHQNISQSEKVYTVRRLFKMGEKVNPLWARAAKSSYGYMRVLDDMVDESTEVLPVREFIKNEKRTISTGKSTDLQEEYLGDSFSELLGNNENRAREYMGKIMSGMLMDLNVRYTQKPLTESQLKARNFRVTYYPFAVLFLGTIGVDAKPTTGTLNLFNTFATYDNVGDIVEDLPKGLTLISKEDLAEYGLNFQNGLPLPKDALKSFYQKKGAQVRKDLVKASSEIFHLGLPLWFSTILYVYFCSRSAKLLLPIRDFTSPIYQAPRDSLINGV